MKLVMSNNNQTELFKGDCEIPEDEAVAISGKLLKDILETVTTHDEAEWQHKERMLEKEKALTEKQKELTEKEKELTQIRLELTKLLIEGGITGDSLKEVTLAAFKQPNCTEREKLFEQNYWHDT